MNMQSLLQAGFFLQINSSGRLVATVYAVLGLISVIIGWLALARSRRTGSARAGAIVALVVGFISVVFCGMHLGMATGEFGSGSGRLGAIVGLVVGLIGVILGWLALARSRRIATSNNAATAGKEAG